MKRTVLCLCLFAMVFGVGMAQTKEERAKHSTEILAKTARVNLLNQILPVLLTKEQINQILPAIEKARQNTEKTYKFEFEQILKLEPELDATIKAGEERNEVPRKEYLLKLQKTYNALDILRRAAIRENVETVRDALNKVLNSGQKKVAASMIDATYFDPGTKPEDMTEAIKLDTYIRVVLLDEQSYSVLIQVLKHAS